MKLFFQSFVFANLIIFSSCSQVGLVGGSHRIANKRTQTTAADTISAVDNKIELNIQDILDKRDRDVQFYMFVDNSPSMETPIAALKNSLGAFVQEITKTQSKATMSVIPFGIFGNVLENATRPGYYFNDLKWLKIAGLNLGLNDPTTILQRGIEFPNGIGIARESTTPGLRGIYTGIKSTGSLDEAKNAISSIAIDPSLSYERGLALAADYFGFLEDIGSLPSASQIAIIFLSSEDSMVSLDATADVRDSLFREDQTFPKYRSKVNASVPRDLIGYHKNDRRIVGKAVRGDACSGATPTAFKMKKFCTPTTARTSGAIFDNGKTYTYSQLIGSDFFDYPFLYCKNTVTAEEFYWSHYPTVQNCLTYAGHKYKVVDGIGTWVGCGDWSEGDCQPDTSSTPFRRNIQQNVTERFISNPNSCQPLNCGVFMKQASQANSTNGKLSSITPLSCPAGYSIENATTFLPTLDKKVYCASDLQEPVTFNQNDISREGVPFEYQDYMFDTGVTLNQSDYTSMMIPWLKQNVYSGAISANISSVSSGPEPVGYVANGQGFADTVKTVFAGKTVAVHGIVSLNDTPCAGVNGEFSKGTQYLEAIKQTGGISSSVCDASYDGILSKIGQDVNTKLIQDYHIDLGGKKIFRVEFKDTKKEITADQYDLLDNNTTIHFKFPLDKSMVIVIHLN